MSGYEQLKLTEAGSQRFRTLDVVSSFVLVAEINLDNAPKYGHVLCPYLSRQLTQRHPNMASRFNSYSPYHSAGWSSTFQSIKFAFHKYMATFYPTG